MKLIAESLKKYGTYFQNGYHKKGKFDPMFDFENTNSNSAIKIIKLINHQLVELQILNKEKN
jgi:hypothetical protein